MTINTVVLFVAGIF